MQNFVQDGDILDLPAPSGGAIAGKGYLIGGIFGVAVDTALVGVSCPFAVEGVFALDAKTTDTFNAGDPVYWDSATNGGQCTSTKTGNTFIGACTFAKANGDATMSVNLFERTFAPVAAITPPAATAASNSAPYGYTTQAQADAIRAAVINIIAALEKAGIAVPN